MKLREYHPLSEMERVPAEELPKRLDELFDRMDKENVGFVVTEEGKDSCVSGSTSHSRKRTINRSTVHPRGVMISLI